MSRMKTEQNVVVNENGEMLQDLIMKAILGVDKLPSTAVERVAIDKT
jgi:hypothetical protein